MNKAFEKILERFDAKKQYFQKFYEADGKTEEDEYINKATQLAFDDAKEIVQEVAEEYKGGWIPCSERLPEAGKRYLVSAIWKDKDFEKSAVYDAVYGSDGLWHSYNYEPVSYKIIAWKPLPEPFKGRD